MQPATHMVITINCRPDRYRLCIDELSLYCIYTRCESPIADTVYVILAVWTLQIILHHCISVDSVEPGRLLMLLMHAISIAQQRATTRFCESGIFSPQFSAQSLKKNFTSLSTSYSYNFCFILYAMSLGNRCDSSTAMLDLDLTTLFTSKPVRLQLRMQNGYQFLAVHAGFLWRWLEAQNRRGHIQQTQAGMHCVCYFYRKTL